MDEHTLNLVTEKFSRLDSDFKIQITQKENWNPNDVDEMHQAVSLLARALGGGENLKHLIGGVFIERVDIGAKLGLAYKDKIQFSAGNPVKAWSVVHEMAHVWDAKNDWNLSRELEDFTGGFTNPILSAAKRLSPGEWDAGFLGAENQPGKYGRKPGINKAGYFYGDKPSGSNWNFNRVEDFAESVVMYCGWMGDNILSDTAHGRIERYLLPNGSKDPIYGITENWSDYAQYFYPEGGDYKKTKRWKFVEDLIRRV
jgi:hypothetical protein